MQIRHLTKTIHRTQYPAIDPTNPTNSVAGKTVVVSSGASGIGYAIARGFCAAGAANIVVLTRRREALEEASTKLEAEITAAKGTTSVWTYLLDIRDTTATDAVFRAIRARLNAGSPPDDQPKDIDAVVTSAADVAQGQTLVDFELDVVRNAYDTNALGNLNVLRAFLAPEAPAIPLVSMTGLVKDVSGAKATGREKVFIDVSSLAAYAVLPGQSIYAGSKLAFSRMVRQLQAEVDQLEGAPVRLFSFHPGGLFTPAAQKVGVKEDFYQWDDESLPAGFAVWLASPAAAFVKGRSLLSSWDVEEMMAMRERFEEDPELATITLKV